MLWRRSLCFTAFTPLSVRFTTSGWVGMPGVGAGALAVIGVDGGGGGGCCERSNAGKSKIAPAKITFLPAVRFPLPASRFPLPVSRHLLPASRPPLPASRLPPFQESVVARRGCDALDKPFHGGTGRHLL